MMSHYDDEEDERECAACGMPQSVWQGNDGKGIISKSGDIFCCEGCSLGTGCTCENVSEQTRIRSA